MKPVFLGAAGVAADQQFGIFDSDAAVWDDGMCQPDVAPDDAVMADARVATENRRTRINSHTVFNVGVAFVGRATHEAAI